MKIGFLIYSLSGGGAERVVTTLANEFAKKEQVYIYIFDSSRKSAYDIDSRVTVRECSISFEKNLIKRFFNRVVVLKKLLQQDSIETLFVFMASLISYAVLSKSRRCKVIGAERQSPKLHKKKIKFVINLFSPFCDGFIFQTKGAQSFYPTIVKKKSVVIQNPVFPVTNFKEKKEGIQFCAAGRKEATKDFFTILKAFNIFRKEYPDSKLTFFCNKELECFLQPEIQELDLQNNILFAGFVKDLPTELSACQIFLFSSRSEGMPNVLMEAMGAGLACIATDCDFGPRELIQNGENGILIPVGDFQSMAKVMKYLIENPSEASRIANEAKKINETNSVEKITDAFKNYASEIKGKRKCVFLIKKK